MTGRGRLRLAFVLLLIGAGIAASTLLPVRAYLATFLGAVEALGPWAPVLLGAAYVPAAVLMLPGSVLTLGAGFVAGVPLGFLAVTVGANLGALCAFFLGRTLARDWVERRVGKYPRFDAVQAAIGAHGFKIVVLTRLSPLFPFNFLNYALGVTRVRVRDFVLGSLLGMMPGTLMYVYLGAGLESLAAVAAGEVKRGPLELALFGVGLVVTVVVAVIVTRTARRVLEETVPGVDEDPT